jgi:hypothetical protein
MTTLRNKLIECGYWKTDDPRNPAIDAGASATLLNIMKNELSQGVRVNCLLSADIEKEQFMEVFITRGDNRTRLACAGDLYTAICKAALALSDFLRQRPDCAKGATAD